MEIHFEFTAKPWIYQAPGGWHFVSLPPNTSQEIRAIFKNEEEGWGRLKAKVNIGNTEWKTAIWFDTKMNTYLLPLKAEIRKKENISIREQIKVAIWI